MLTSPTSKLSSLGSYGISLLLAQPAEAYWEDGLAMVGGVLRILKRARGVEAGRPGKLADSGDSGLAHSCHSSF